MTTVIYITSVEQGKNTNWLIFTATIGQLDRNKEYTFEFCGTEINNPTSLNKDAIENLRNQLLTDFGFAPYDIKKCEEIIGNYGKEYTIEY